MLWRAEKGGNGAWGWMPSADLPRDLQVWPKLAISTVLCTPCRLQKEKQDAEAAREESAGKAAADLEALRAEAAAAEQRLQAAQVRFISS